MERVDLTDAFEEAITAVAVNDDDLERIDSRACGSDRYDGISYDFYGSAVPIKPIIDVVAEVEGHGIEEFNYYDSHINGTPHLNVFVATFGKQDHPAFAP